MEGRFEPAVVAPFPVDPVDPVDPVKNSGRLVFAVFYKVFFMFFRKMNTILGGWALWCPPGADMTPVAIQTAAGVEHGGLLGHILAPRWAK